MVNEFEKPEMQCHSWKNNARYKGLDGKVLELWSGFGNNGHDKWQVYGWSRGEQGELDVG